MKSSDLQHFVVILIKNTAWVIKSFQTVYFSLYIYISEATSPFTILKYFPVERRLATFSLISVVVMNS